MSLFAHDELSFAGIEETMSDALNERLRLIRFRRKRERTRFRDELRIIPKWLVWLCMFLWIVAIVIGMSVNVHLARTGQSPFPGDGTIPDLGESCAALAGVITAAALVVSIMLFMLGYVYRDAKRRGMNAALWTLLVLILSGGYFLIGLIIYLLVREPLPYTCPQCAATVNARFNFCPSCKYNLHPACPQCQREVDDTDKFCPYCATELTPASKIAGETPIAGSPLP
jgi:RNA polymerase subunit RPABC4/transcription elongation factor Spt4